MSNDDGESEYINGKTHNLLLTEEEICVAWTRLSRHKYSTSSSVNIFEAWLKVINDCIAGRPLTGQHLARVTQSKIVLFCPYIRRNGLMFGKREKKR